MKCRPVIAVAFHPCPVGQHSVRPTARVSYSIPRASLFELLPLRVESETMMVGQTKCRLSVILLCFRRAAEDVHDCSYRTDRISQNIPRVSRSSVVSVVRREERTCWGRTIVSPPCHFCFVSPYSGRHVGTNSLDAEPILVTAVLCATFRA